VQRSLGRWKEFTALRINDQARKQGKEEGAYTVVYDVSHGRFERIIVTCSTLFTARCFINRKVLAINQYVLASKPAFQDSNSIDLGVAAMH
jgi:hypothetical protein